MVGFILLALKTNDGFRINMYILTKNTSEKRLKFS